MDIADQPNRANTLARMHDIAFGQPASRYQREGALLQSNATASGNACHLGSLVHRAEQPKEMASNSTRKPATRTRTAR
jgi:hypothetical protein